MLQKLLQPDKIEIFKCALPFFYEKNLSFYDKWILKQRLEELKI